MGVEQREQFIDSMFAIFSHTNASTLKELREDWTKNAFISHLMLFFKKKEKPLSFEIGSSPEVFSAFEYQSFNLQTISQSASAELKFSGMISAGVIVIP